MAAAAFACDGCLARTWLLERLSAHLDVGRARIGELLPLPDAALIAQVAGADAAGIGTQLAGFDPDADRARRAAGGLEALCRCDPRYPAALRDLPAPPAVLHLAGRIERLHELSAAPAAAIVGARRASPYALEAARALARGAGLAGATVVSGMALGVDAAAHEGALEVGGGTIAVLACSPERAYPAAARMLHRRIAATGAVVSELGPGVAVRRWMFPARNRLIAALGAITVLAAARRGSGALLTAQLASDLGRELGAVPGQITAPLSWGPHRLLRAGARLVAEPADLLEALLGPGCGPHDTPVAPLEPRLEALLDALADGYQPSEAFALAGLSPTGGLAALAELELWGRVRRGPGGRIQTQ